MQFPCYDENFVPLGPGYHDHGPEKRILNVGRPVELAEHTDTVQTFLDVMEFASEADRSNAVAAALTVLLRHHYIMKPRPLAV